VDDDLFAGSAARLGIDFDWVVTAQQVGSYKPGHAHFLEIVSRFGGDKDRILHVAQSLFHDVAPARALGFTTLWINRRAGQHGTGATPLADAVPDAEVPDMAGAAALLLGGRQP
jgi:2-haloacid dehalogenase